MLNDACRTLSAQSRYAYSVSSIKVVCTGLIINNVSRICSPELAKTMLSYEVPAEIISYVFYPYDYDVYLFLLGL